MCVCGWKEKGLLNMACLHIRMQVMIQLSDPFAISRDGLSICMRPQLLFEGTSRPNHISIVSRGSSSPMSQVVFIRHYKDFY